MDLLRLLASFLIGSVPFAVLAMRGTGVNILQYGSGNPGFNNVLRYDKRRAIFCLLGDFGKGAFAMWLLRRPEDTYVMAWLLGFAAILGHCYSPFLKFNGGKGIATSGGVMLMLYPVWAGISLTYFTIIRVMGSKKRWLEAGTIASLSAWLLFTILAFLFVGVQDGLYSTLMTLFLSWRHKTNFRILAEGRRKPEAAVATHANQALK